MKKSNATTYRIEGELRDWVRDYAHKRNISQTTLVRRVLEFHRRYFDSVDLTQLFGDDYED